jgi:hypothetical protein
LGFGIDGGLAFEVFGAFGAFAPARLPAFFADPVALFAGPPALFAWTTERFFSAAALLRALCFGTFLPCAEPLPRSALALLR